MNRRNLFERRSGAALMNRGRSEEGSEKLSPVCRDS